MPQNKNPAKMCKNGSVYPSLIFVLYGGKKIGLMPTYLNSVVASICDNELIHWLESPLVIYLVPKMLSFNWYLRACVLDLLPPHSIRL